ncbi:unnamed protein product [Brassica rapa subsp. narinosa]
MILKNDDLVYSFSFSFHRIHNGYDQVIYLKNSEDVKISTISHCKGLLLCMTEDNRLVVWKLEPLYWSNKVDPVETI